MGELRRTRDVTASLAKLTFDIAAAGASTRLPEPLQRGMGVVKFRRHLVAALRPRDTQFNRTRQGVDASEKAA